MGRGVFAGNDHIYVLKTGSGGGQRNSFFTERLPWPPAFPTLAENRSMAMAPPQLAPLETPPWWVQLGLELSCYV
jgi:hypothetical protein